MVFYLLELENATMSYCCFASYTTYLFFATIADLQWYFLVSKTTLGNRYFHMIHKWTLGNHFLRQCPVFFTCLFKYHARMQLFVYCQNKHREPFSCCVQPSEKTIFWEDSLNIFFILRKRRVFVGNFFPNHMCFCRVE